MVHFHTPAPILDFRLFLRTFHFCIYYKLHNSFPLYTVKQFVKRFLKVRRKAIYIYLHHSHFWFLSSLLWVRFFLLSFSSVWGTPFNILSCSVGDGFLPILMIWKSLSFLQIWKKISLGVKLKVVNFHSYKKAVAPLSSRLGLFPARSLLLLLSFSSLYIICLFIVLL